MSSPAVTCGGDASLAAAARTMSEAGTGSVVVTEMAKVKHPMDAGQKGQKGIEW